MDPVTPQAELTKVRQSENYKNSVHQEISGLYSFDLVAIVVACITFTAIVSTVSYLFGHWGGRRRLENKIVAVAQRLERLEEKERVSPVTA